MYSKIHVSQEGSRWKDRLTFYESVFVRGGGTRQDPELGPDLINPLLLNL